ncbi:multifunctional tRNA nucleotidyl transferase/2'3'-cyclic phosphodiesterase/2'nucleotidase/phosphatase [Actinobacillus equuli]|nr:multifunctional tRNA nucleotidyl transferase/2'3'-cyclic phosphodiesterase/2'nucleotidase/phosphatase [Actinobacillus equuli]
MAELRSETVLKVFNALDVWRKPQRFFDFLLACEADARGRLGFEEREYPQAELAKRYFEAANQVDVQQVIADGYEKQAIRDELNKRRANAIATLKKNSRTLYFPLNPHKP